MSVSLKLKYPIPVGDTMVTELVFQPLKAKHKRDLVMKDGVYFGPTYKLAADLSGQPDAVIGELQGEDLVAVEEIIAGFLQPGAKTGSTP